MRCWRSTRPEALTCELEREPSRSRTVRDRMNTKARFLAILPARFKTMFRMHRCAFDELVELLEPTLRRPTRCGMGGSLEPWIIVAMGVRWLAGGSHHDIGFGYDVCSSTFYNARDEFIDAIHKTRELDLCSPFIERDGGEWDWDVVSALKQLERAFCDKKGEWIRGIFGAVDGIAVQTSCPHKSQCNGIRGPAVFFNRKGFYAIVCQAVCDAQRRFLFVSASSEGSCPDAISVAQSELGTRMAMKPPPKPFMLVGDAAYEAETWTLTPYAGNKLPADKDAFNFFQSSYRIEIECAFGLLCRRWGVLWRPLSGASLPRATQVIVACCKLHNFCIDKGDNVGPPVCDGTTIEPQVDFHPQDECEDLDLSKNHRRKRMRECSTVRDALAATIVEKGGQRPALKGNRTRRPGEATRECRTL